MRIKHLFITAIAAASLVACSDDTKPNNVDGGKKKEASVTEGGGKTEGGGGAEGGGGGSVCKGTCTAKADCPTGAVDCVSGSCVYCKADSDCTYGLKKCDTTLGSCKFCSSDSDCTVSGVKILTGKCDTATSQCTKCSADADCTAVAGGAYKACGSKNVCTTCKTSSDCTGTGGTTTCVSSGDYAGYCYGCTADADCKTAFGTGNTETWACK
jgi:hypothetical protein